MKSFINKTLIKKVRKKRGRSSAILFAFMTTGSLMWIEFVYRFFTTQAVFNGDIIHIALINGSFAFVFVTLLTLLPSIYHRSATFLFLLIFVLAAPVFTTLTLSHVQYGQLDFLLNEDLFALYEQRYEAFILSEFWAYGIGLSWLLLPFRIRRRPLATIKVGVATTIVVVGAFFYLINPNYSNLTEQSNNWELLIYQENPGITRSRLGINQATINTIVNRPLFIRPQELDVLGDISEYFNDNDTTSRNASVNLRNKNLVIIQVEGLTFRAMNSRVMPFVTGQFYDQSVRFSNYYADQKEINNYGVNFSLLTGIPTIPVVGNTVEEYAFNNYPHALGNLFRSEGYNTASFFQYYANNEEDLIKNAGFTRQFDYFDFPRVIDNDVDFVKEALPRMYGGRNFVAYINLNNPHANRKEEIIESLSPLASSSKELEYLSQMFVVDQAVQAVYSSLDAEGILNNTAIMLIGTNPNLDSIDIARPGRILQYRVPLLIYTGQEGEDLDPFLGAIDVVPTLMSMYRFSPENNYLGSNVFVRKDNLVGFHDGSWITEVGHYDSLTQRFAMNSSSVASQTLSTYVSQTMQEIQERYRIARFILERNYYGVESV